MTMNANRRRSRIEPIVIMTWLSLIALPLWVAVNFARPVNGPDTFWHLALGHKLRQTWDFGPHDPLSPLTTMPWVYNQWLPEVVASWFEDIGGLPAVAWFAVAGRFLILILLWRACRSRASALPALAATFLGFLGTFGAWDARPQLFGIALFVVAANAALRTAEDGQARWWLIPLTWLWAMVHGTWPLAILMWLVIALAAVLDRPDDGWRRHAARLCVPIGAAIVAALTPVGLRLYTTFTAISNVNADIREWQPLSLTSPILAIPVFSLCLVVIAWARRWMPKPNWARVALLIFALGCMLMYARTIAVGSVIAALLLAEALQAVVPRRDSNARRETLALALAISAALCYGALALSVTARLPGDAPTGLSDILANQPASVVLNEQGVGGWIHWAHAHLTPVFDTRAEVYGPAAIDKYFEIVRLGPGWEDALTASGARLALLQSDSPLAYALTTQKGWVLLGEDAGFVLLRRP